jgi:hypothetical protein
MKKVLLSIVGTLALVLVPMASASALEAVSGHVSQAKTDVSGASVSATCKSATGSGTTGANGDYAFTLSPSGVCTSTDLITVTAQKGAASGQTTQPYGNLNLGEGINIALVNVSIPEFGAIAGVSAAVLGGAAFMIVRRKHLNQN